jgi:5-methylcytosine-specific restriction protein A
MPGWEGSTRRATLPPNWNNEIRPAVIERDQGLCQWTEPTGRAINRRGQRICGAPGVDVDHTGDRNDHRLHKLRLLCEPHHDRRSAQQGGNSYTPLTRAPEQHPALG